MLEFFIVKDAEGAALYIDGVAGIEEGLGCGGSEAGAVLKGLGLDDGC